MRHLKTHVIKAFKWFLRIQNLPFVPLYVDFEEVSDVDGFWSDSRSIIQLNMGSILTNNNNRGKMIIFCATLQTLFHELIHYWQSKVYGEPKLKAYSLLFNNGAHDLYLQNPMEIEARSLGRDAFIQFLREYWDDQAKS